MHSFEEWQEPCEHWRTEGAHGRNGAGITSPVRIRVAGGSEAHRQPSTELFQACHMAQQGGIPSKSQRLGG